jgi:hypothetical protein
MKRTAIVAGLVFVALTIGSCAGTQPDAAPNVGQLDSLREAIDAGAECSELFAQFDRIDEDSEEFAAAQGELAAVGCATPDSARTDAEPAPEAPSGPWPGVPGNEVEPSPDCKEAGEAAALETDSTEAEPLIETTLYACITVDEWMSVLAVQPGIMGMRSGYIPQLVDLESVCYAYIESPVCQDALARGIELKVDE